MAASPHHSLLPQSEDDDSPFSMLKGQLSDDQLVILGTRSLDEDSQDSYNKNSRRNMALQETYLPATALHASFDSSLAHNQFDSEPLETENVGMKNTASGDSCDVERTGNRHTLRGKSTQSLETSPLFATRKQPGKPGNTSRTPARPRSRPLTATKKPSASTPNSAVKRRRAPLPQRQSPMRRLHPATPYQAPIMSPPSTSTHLDNSIFVNPYNATLLTSTPAQQTATFGIKSLSKGFNTHNTGTTATSTVVETTLESSDSVDTSSPTTTRFRFTSFPASLPRVNNPRSAECPDSIRKRMSFAEPSTDMNQSRDDDGTQNTSISSLSAEGHHQHLQPAPGSLPPPILHLDSRAQGGEHEDDDSLRPVHARLFTDDEHFGYSDDDTTQSPVRDIVGRTRLNFNTVVSPKKRGIVVKSDGTTLMPLDLNMELSRPYDQRRIGSFPSSLSSYSNMNNLSGCEEHAAVLTPARSGEKDFPLATPNEVQLNFPLEAECSPIPGIRDDAVECEFDHPGASGSDTSGDIIGEGLLSRRTQADCIADSIQKTKEESSMGSSDSTAGRSRRLRPMPDMSAFENNAVSSRGERSTDDSATLDSQGAPSTHRLTCPPTPVRTPAWASEGGAHAFLGRQNSLITTKVLLSVPSQVLEGRCSLENSVLDDDSKQSRGCTRPPPARLPSVQPMDEDDGKEAGKERITDTPSILSGGAHGRVPESAVKMPKLQAPPKLMRRVPTDRDAASIISFSADFEILGKLGSGAFADVYKVRYVQDNRLYAVKRNRRQFRGKRDRDMALTEVQAMQRLQSVCAQAESNSSGSEERSSYCLYLLFFYRAWQEDGYFLCQTELCCRDTCRELLDSLRFLWNSAKTKYPSLIRNLPHRVGQKPGSAEDSGCRLMPNDTIWKICHDISAGLSHIHSHGLVHHDIKPSNIFFVGHPRFGAMCKIGDFGMAGEIGSSADGLEGDTRYMAPELLSSGTRHPSSDIFSLGLTLYEIATDQQLELPSEGPRWHDLRNKDGPKLPPERGDELQHLIQSMRDPTESNRPTANSILNWRNVSAAGQRCDRFLGDYIVDIDAFDRAEAERLAMDCHEGQTPRNGSNRSTVPVQSPSLSMLLPNAPSLLSPMGASCK